MKLLRLFVLAVTMLLPAVAGAGKDELCLVDPATAVFTDVDGGVLTPGPDPACLYHQHELRAGPRAPGLPSAVVSMNGPKTPAYPRSARLAATPSSLRFDGSGGPARLQLEYLLSDVPDGFGAETMRAYVSCPGPGDPLAPRPPCEPPPPASGRAPDPPRSVWCMPDVDPELDLDTRTVATRIVDWPRAAVALPRISTIDRPADWTFTRTSPIEVKGHVADFDLRLGLPSGSHAGYCVSLERRGETGEETWLPSLDPETGAFLEPALALEENENWLTAWAVDPSYDRSFDRVVVVLDTKPPRVALSGVGDGAHVASPVTLLLDEVERWPDRHRLSGERRLAPFLGEPDLVEPIDLADADLRLVAETPPEERRFEAPPFTLEGDYGLSFVATDRAGNQGEARIGFTIDVTPPVATLAGVTEGSYLRVTAQVTAEVTDRNLLEAHVEATMDGAPDPDFACTDSDPDGRLHVCTGRAAQEGLYVVTAWGKDRAGNVSATAALSFTVDRTRPEVVLAGVAEGEFLREPFTLTVQVSDRNRDPAAERAKLYRDGVLVEERSEADPSFSIAEEGEYRLEVTAADLAGNAQSAVRSFGLDLHDPEVTIDDPRAGAMLAAGHITARGAVTERFLERVTVEPGGREASFAAGAWVLADLELHPGENAIAVTATDRSGRTGRTEVTVVHDGEPPWVVLTLPVEGLTREPEAEVEGEAGDEHLEEVRLDGRLLARYDGIEATHQVAERLRLAEGDNEVVLEARDRAGNLGRASRRVTLDTVCDLLLVLSPGDGHRTRAAEVEVAGVARDAHGIEVEVAGAPATRSGEEFRATVALAEGENRIETVGLDGAGNECRVTTRVTRDSAGPRLLAYTPGAGASGVDLGEPLRLELSEPVRVNDGLRVSVPGVVRIDGTNVSYQPGGGWPSDGRVVVDVTAAVTDALGNALSNPETWEFTTADRTGPAAPVLASLQEATALVTIAVCGEAEAGTRVRIEGGTSPVESEVAPDGGFCADVHLERDVLAQLVATARDGAGNVSPPAVAFVRQESAAPFVLGALLAGEPGGDPWVEVSFSREMDCATVDGSTVLLEDGAGPKAAEIACDGLATRVTSSEISLASDPFLIVVTTGALDRLGNALAYRFSKLFNSSGLGFVTGEVYDAASGLRLEGASVEVVRVEEREPVRPAPRALSDGAGGFRVPIAEVGRTWLKASKAGYAEVYREVASAAGLAVPAFDFRLAPLAAADVALPEAGGTVRDGERQVSLTVPAGLPAGSRLRLTSLPLQGLAARLPAGWSPLWAVDLRPELSFPGAATLRVPAAAGLVPADEVQLVRFDLAAWEWVVGLPPSLSGDGRTLAATVEASGSYAFVVADRVPVLPPQPVLARALPGVPVADVRVGRPDCPEPPCALEASMRIDPGTILPGGRAESRVELSFPEETTSGLPLQADVAERLERLDDRVVELPSYTADVTLYREGSELPLEPQGSEGLEVYREGRIRVKVYEFPEDAPEGGVVDGRGGRVGIGDLALSVPEAAVEGPTPVVLTRREAAELEPADLAGFEPILGIEVSFGGSRLHRGGTLEAALAELPPVDARFVLLHLVTALGRRHWAFAAEAIVDESLPKLVSLGVEPGVRAEGLYAFFQVAQAYRRLGGFVHDPAGEPVDGALVTVTSPAGWPAALSYHHEESDEHGRFFTVVGAADMVEVLAVSPLTGDEGRAGTPGEEVVVLLRPTPPFVTFTDPAAGARLAPGRPVLIAFSEPVDPRTLGAGIRVTVAGQPVAGVALGVLGGQRAVFDPVGEWPANAEVRVEVTSLVKDLAGHGCAPPGAEAPAPDGVCASFTWRTLDTEAPARPPDGAVRVWAPDDQGRICVEAPATPGTVSVAATNLSTGVSATLAWDAGLGRYAGCIAGAYGERIQVAYLDDAGNATSEEHTLFLERGGDVPAVRVGPQGGRIAVADADGTVALSVPAGAFAATTLLTLDPLPVEALELGAEPEGFEVLAPFALGTDGQVAAADLEVALEPAGVGPEDQVLLVRVVEARGQKYPEFVGQMELRDGKLRTRLPALTLETGPASASPGAGEAKSAAEGASAQAEAERVPGLRRPGRFAAFRLRSDSADLSYFLLYLNPGQVAIGTVEGLSDFAYYAFDATFPGVLPVPSGTTFTVEVLDASTGRPRTSRSYPGIPRGHGTSDPTGGASGPVWVRGASPTRTRLFTVTRVQDQVAAGIVATALAPDEDTDGVPDLASFELEVRGSAGSVQAGAAVRLHLGRSDQAREVEAGEDGSFVLPRFPVELGDELVLALEAFAVEPDRVLSVELNREVTAEDLEAGVKLTSGRGSAGVTILGEGRRFTLRPAGALALGERYRLEVETAGMAGPFAAYFRTREVDERRADEAARMEDANELVRVGGLLFVAAGSDGLKVLDVSVPGTTSEVGSLAMSGRARGLVAFHREPGPPPAGLHLAVVGGGNEAAGWLRVVDVSSADKLEQPELAGAEIVTNRVGATEDEQFAGIYDGVPLRVEAARFSSAEGATLEAAFVAVLGVGLEVFDLGRLAPGLPQPPSTGGARIDRHYSEGAQDVALLPRGGELLAVLAAGQHGLEVLRASDPSALEPLGALELSGNCRAVEVFPRFPLPQQDGTVRETDLAFVAAQGEGVHVVDLSDPFQPVRLATLRVAGSVLDLELDLLHQRALLSLGSEGLLLLDVSDPLRPETDPGARVLARLAVTGGNFNTGLAADFELGAFHASSEGEGVVEGRIETPRPRFVTGELGALVEWLDIVPLGILAREAHTSIVRVALSLPGGVGRRVYVALEPLDAYGEPMRDGAWPGIAGRLRPLALLRQSDDRTSPGYNLYLSEELRFTADPRLVDPDRTTVMAGDRIRARLLGPGEVGEPDAPELGWLRPEELQAAVGEVRSWRMDFVPGPRQAPAGLAATGSGDVLGVLLHSGELVYEETDLAVPGRALDFVWSRHTRSQALYHGPIGRGWDSPLFARVRELPDGDVEYFDGTGARWTFTRRATPRKELGYDAPAGLALALHDQGDRFEISDADGLLRVFNGQGDLFRLEDLNGNRLELLRDAAGRLRTVRDDLGRYYPLEHDPEGRIASVGDFSGRRVTYAYDPATGELATRTRFGEHVTAYGYGFVAGAGSPRALQSVTDEARTTWLSVTYRDGRVESEQWGKAEERVGLAYDGSETTVTDRRGHKTRYVHDPANGRLLEVHEEDPEDGEATTSYEWLATGALERVTYPEKNGVEYGYESEAAPLADPRRVGNATLVRRLPRPGSEEAPEELGYKYDPGPAPRVVSRTDERGKQTLLRYDGHGNLEELTRLFGSEGKATVLFAHNVYGQVTLESGPETDQVTTYVYWPATSPGGTVVTRPAAGLDDWTGGYLKSLTVGEGTSALRTYYEHDALGRMTRRVNPLGGEWRGEEYDPRGLLLKEAQVAGSVSSEVNHTYDGRGLPDLTTYVHTGAGDGTVTIDEDHEDPLGFRTRVTVSGPGLDPPVVTSWLPDPNRNLAELTHPLGGKEVFTYDVRDRLIATERRPAPSPGEAPAPTVVHRGYDLNGNPTRVSSPRNEAWLTRLEYDGHDRLKTELHPLRRESEPGEEPISEDLTVERTYYPGGLAKLERHLAPLPADAEPDAEPEVLFAAEREYDDLGYLVKLKEGPDPQGETGYAPDRAGRVSKRTDRRGKEWLYEHWPSGALKKETDPLGNVTSYDYAPGERQAKLTRDGVETTYFFDPLGRLVQVRDPDGHEQGFTHDSRGNVQTATDGLRKATAYGYDALDRLVREDGPEGELVERTWDAEGSLRTYADARGNVTTYEYDAFGRLAKLTYPGDPEPVVTTYTYDASDALETETTPEGHVLRYGHDAGGRLVSRVVKEDASADAETLEEESYGTDALGRMVRAENRTAIVTRAVGSFGQVEEETVEVKGTGLARTLRRTFDVGLLLASLTYPGGRALAHVPDDLGRLHQVLEGAAPVASYGYAGPERVQTKTIGEGLAWSFGYEDREHRLTSITGESSAGGPARKVFDWGLEDYSARHELKRETDRLRRGVGSAFEYDGAGRLRSGQLPERELAYAVDAARNLTERIETAGGPYGRCEAARVMTGNRYESYAGRMLGYDDAGNLSSGGRGDSYVHDWAGRLVRAVTEAGTVSYAYDALGRKVKREVEGGATELWWYDGWELVEVTDLAGNRLYEAVNGRGIDEPLLFTDERGEEKRLLQDRLGNVAGVLDERGKVLEAWRYDPFGRARRHGPERVDHVRLQDETFLVNERPVVKRVLVARFTGEVQLEPAALSLVPGVEGAWELSGDGRELRFVPEDGWPDADVELTVAKELHSAFGIELAEGRSVTWDAGEAGEGVLADWVAPAVERVTQATNGEIEVLFSEALDPGSLEGAFTLLELASGRKPFTASVRPGDARVAVVDSSEPFTPGEQYALELVAGVAKDRAGTPAAAGSFPWTAEETALLVWDRGYTRPSEFSETGNRFAFQGRVLDPTTGLMDFRARWYSPELGRFLQPDPTGHTDGNLYVAFAADPVNNTDSAGTHSERILSNGLRAYVPGEDEIARGDFSFVIDFPDGDRKVFDQHQAEVAMFSGMNDALLSEIYGRDVASIRPSRSRLWWNSLWHHKTDIGVAALAGLTMLPQAKAVPAPAARLVETAPAPAPAEVAAFESEVAAPAAGLAPAPALPKRVPNPYGKLGGPAHRAKVGEVEADMARRGLEVRKEVRVETVDGVKSVRYVDVVGIDPRTGRVVEVHQVGRGLASDPRVPVARERTALRDIRRSPELRGARRVFHPY